MWVWPLSVHVWIWLVIVACLVSVCHMPQVNSFICEFIHMWIHSYVNSIIFQFIHMWIRSYINSFICEFIHMWLHSYVNRILSYVNMTWLVCVCDMTKCDMSQVSNATRIWKGASVHTATCYLQRVHTADSPTHTFPRAMLTVMPILLTHSWGALVFDSVVAAVLLPRAHRTCACGVGIAAWAEMFDWKQYHDIELLLLVTLLHLLHWAVAGRAAASEAARSALSLPPSVSLPPLPSLIVVHVWKHERSVSRQRHVTQATPCQATPCQAMLCHHLAHSHLLLLDSSLHRRQNWACAFVFLARSLARFLHGRCGQDERPHILERPCQFGYGACHL